MFVIKNHVAKEWENKRREVREEYTTERKGKRREEPNKHRCNMT